eukprot:TRINITY_DN382_c4_g1_i1.p1 TRINITY_DN382_c4_g1~~TRINITY_DN382_c4_g1_i1.p1  ORF type:complete len:382 (+),score=60.07 TRINITY_DN382_c4_g1_i1:66-1211(+)
MSNKPYPYEVTAKIAPQGSGHNYEYTAEALKEERDAVWTFVRRLGATFYEGKDLVSVSMPVTLCEPASFLERMCRGWVTMPSYCKAILDTKCEIERMKLVVAMVVSGLHKNLNCKKPFNPVLGETYEATFEDGSHIHVEQTSHHPPVSSWEVHSHDNTWKFTGTAKWSGYFAGNAVKGGQQGVNCLEFSDGYRVEWVLPNIHVSGVLSGNRILDHVGAIEFKDNSTPSYTCKVGFGDQRKLVEWMQDSGKWIAGALTGGWLSGGQAEAKVQDDELTGEIFLTPCSGNAEKKVVVATVMGSWLKGVDFQDQGTEVLKRYWEKDNTLVTLIDNDLPANVLPTDSRLRKDISHLKENNLDAAQEHKEEIENRQRRLNKIRKGAA